MVKSFERAQEQVCINMCGHGAYHAAHRTTNSTSTDWTLGPVYNAVANMRQMKQNVCATNISHNQSDPTIKFIRKFPKMKILLAPNEYVGKQGLADSVVPV